MARKRQVRRVRRARRGRRSMRGRGFFGSLWDGIKSAVTKPSTWLGAAGMLPTPLAPAFKLGGIVSGLAGHGRRRRGRGMYSSMRGSGFVRF